MNLVNSPVEGNWRFSLREVQFLQAIRDHLLPRQFYRVRGAAEPVA
jgi:hypothetical protein